MPSYFDNRRSPLATVQWSALFLAGRNFLHFKKTELHSVVDMVMSDVLNEQYRSLRIFNQEKILNISLPG